MKTITKTEKSDTSVERHMSPLCPKNVPRNGVNKRLAM